MIFVKTWLLAYKIMVKNFPYTIESSEKSLLISIKSFNVFFGMD